MNTPARSELGQTDLGRTNQQRTDHGRTDHGRATRERAAAENQCQDGERERADRPLAPGQTPVRYSVVVPVYNEEAVLPATYQRLKAVMDGLDEPYELIFVNDGSSDGSKRWLTSLCASDHNVRVLNFSRNFGHQVAISAGMDHASGEAVIVIDADLQDPPELIPELVAKWREGYDVVYARRTRRQGESAFKRWTAAAFYRVLRRLTDVDIPVDTGDFRLIDWKVCQVMRSLQEKGRFVRGLVAWTGFRQTAVAYVRDPRLAGETKYPLRRMLQLAGDAITSFSTKPLKWPLYVGVAMALAGVILLLLALSRTLASGSLPEILFLSSLGVCFNGWGLMAIGILGQYVARIHEESRDRPLYILASREGFRKES
jgi:glycosyltransferase involved in cell wall biosynthesis